MSEGIPKPQSREEVESSAQMTFEEAEHLFGEDFFGSREVEKVFGAKLETIPDIPFSKQELERAKELGQQLIFYTDEMKLATDDDDETTVPLTLGNLNKKFEKAHDGTPMFDQDKHERNKVPSTYLSFIDNMPTLAKQKPRKGWRLTSPGVVPEITYGLNQKEHIETLIEYLKNQVFEGSTMPNEYQDAIVEFEAQKKKLSELYALNAGDDYEPARDELISGANKLAITKLCFEMPVEVAYRLILNDQARQKKQLTNTFTYTAFASRSKPILVGVDKEKGIQIDSADIHKYYWNYKIPSSKQKQFGICLSRGS